MALSKLVHVGLERVQRESVASARVERVYATMKAASVGPVVTGLQLDAIPMQTRPFPTASSPDWFINAYRQTFSKFCGMETMPSFE